MSQQLEQLGKLAKKLQFTDKGERTYLTMEQIHVQTEDGWEEALSIYSERPLIIMWHGGKMRATLDSRCHIFMTDVKIVEEDDEDVLVMLLNKVVVGKITL